MRCDREGYALMFRVEHPKSGKGPWQHYSWDGLERIRGHHPGDLPGPFEDFGEYIPRSHLYGTRSLTQLKLWFHAAHRKAMHRAGFVLNVYRVHKSLLKVGRTQVAAHKLDMRLHDTLSLDTIRIHKEFVSLDAATAFMEQMLKDYDPMAYDTHLSVHKRPGLYGLWVVTGYRFASAD